LAYKIRAKHYLDTTDQNDTNEYIPQLYKKCVRLKFFNLTSTQLHTLKELKDSKDFIIQPSDKNLGPTILNYKNYVKQILEEHLLIPSYQRLSHTEAAHRIESTKQQLWESYHLHKNKPTQAEVKYFKRSLTGFYRNPIFYGMPKVHKSPLSFSSHQLHQQLFINFQHAA